MKIDNNFDIGIKPSIYDTTGHLEISISTSKKETLSTPYKSHTEKR